MPAILPSGPCAQVNPLFRAAPSAPLLAGWHASKTQSGAGPGRGNSFFFLYTWLRRFPPLSLQLWGEMCQSLRCSSNSSLCIWQGQENCFLQVFFLAPSPLSSLQLCTVRKVNKRNLVPEHSSSHTSLGMKIKKWKRRMALGTLEWKPPDYGVIFA